MTTGCLLIIMMVHMMVINDHDNNQHDDNADKQLVMISSLFDLLVLHFSLMSMPLSEFPQGEEPRSV